MTNEKVINIIPTSPSPSPSSSDRYKTTKDIFNKCVLPFLFVGIINFIFIRIIIMENWYVERDCIIDRLNIVNSTCARAVACKDKGCFEGFPKCSNAFINNQTGYCCNDKKDVCENNLLPCFYINTTLYVSGKNVDQIYECNPKNDNSPKESCVNNLKNKFVGRTNIKCWHPLLYTTPIKIKKEDNREMIGVVSFVAFYNVFFIALLLSLLCYPKCIRERN
jgi:hypothetical protein